MHVGFYLKNIRNSKPPVRFLTKWKFSFFQKRKLPLFPKMMLGGRRDIFQQEILHTFTLKLLNKGVI